ncbi:lipopolysaccharide export LptBFGC system permease protein LptF [Sphingomonas oligoaromativorans]|nr:lipopolysaccharide export LptBFGC system permease protein LptF [Sphingomonas oligoaromativorans]
MPKPDPTPRRRIANPHAWARYWRIMRWMTLLALACVAVALIYFKTGESPVPVHMVIATSLGVFLTVMVGTGLMSLAFLSSGTGHDEDAADPFDKRH